MFVGVTVLVGVFVGVTVLVGVFVGVTDGDGIGAKPQGSISMLQAEKGSSNT